MTLLRYVAMIIVACVTSTAVARAGEITIAAASDLKFAMDDIVASFKATRPSDEVRVVHGSSGKFYSQIQQGAPFDIFFSADVSFAKELKLGGLAATDPKLYAVGRIVLWSAVQDASKLTLRDLSDPVFRKIAIANPEHAPYGKRAEEALRAVGLWDKVEDKLVFGENIAQTAQFVKAGAADIGIIALSLALNQELASRGGYALIPDNLHSPLEQAFIITKKGYDNPLAQTFAQYMESPNARRIMVKYGFVLPSESAM